MRIFSIGIAAATLLTASAALADVRYVSGPSWQTETVRGDALGPAVVVCIHGGDCPIGAVDYQFAPAHSQGANVSWGDAQLIWAAGTTARSPAPLEKFRFVKRFELAALPQSATLLLTADDVASIEVNGVPLGEIGSITSIELAAEANSRPHRFDLTPHLQLGDNVVVITAQNGPDWFAGGHGNGMYSGNPASIAAEISLTGEVTMVSESYDVPPCGNGCGMGQLAGVVVTSLAGLGVLLGLYLGLRRKQ